MEGGLEGWKAGELEDWRTGGLQGWRWKAGALKERCNAQELQGFRAGGLKGWRAGALVEWFKGGGSGQRAAVRKKSGQLSPRDGRPGSSRPHVSAESLSTSLVALPPAQQGKTISSASSHSAAVRSGRFGSKAQLTCKALLSSLLQSAQLQEQKLQHQPAHEERNAACHTSSTCLEPSSLTSNRHPNPPPHGDARGFKGLHAATI